MRLATAGTLAAGLIALAGGNIGAQGYPAKPVRIVTTPAGGANDLTARLIAQEIAGGLGQNVIVENRPTNVLGEFVAKAVPDGYTLALTGGFLWLSPFLSGNVPYDPVRDFAPITLAASLPNVVVVHPSVPTKSVRDLIALAKARPGALNYATSGVGSINHIAGELFKSMAGVNLVAINYTGTGPAITGLLSGQVEAMFASSASVTAHTKSGRLKALAVTSSEPTPLFAGLPTVASALPGYEAVSRLGAFAPAGTPLAVIARLNQEMVRFLRTAEAKDKFFSAGMDAVGSTPEQLGAVVKSEMSRLGKVIRDAGIGDQK